MKRMGLLATCVLALLVTMGATRSLDPAVVNPHTVKVTLENEHVRVFEAVLRNHPHDSRGVLSYLRGGKGAYGYLNHAYAEGDLLRQIAEQVKGDHLRLRCAVPEHALAPGGLTIYGAECGRYPVCPTVIVEW